MTGEEAKENDPVILSAKLVPSKAAVTEPGEAVDGFKDTGVIHDTDIHSDSRHTAHNSQEDNRTKMSELHKGKTKSVYGIVFEEGETLEAEDKKLKEKNQLNLLPGGVRRKIINILTSIPYMRISYDGSVIGIPELTNASNKKEEESSTAKESAEDTLDKLHYLYLEAKHGNIEIIKPIWIWIWIWIWDWDLRDLSSKIFSLLKVNVNDMNQYDMVNQYDMMVNMVLPSLTKQDQRHSFKVMQKLIFQSNQKMEKTKDGSVNEKPEMSNTSDTTEEEQREADSVTLAAEPATPNKTGEEAQEAVEAFKDTGVIPDPDIHSDGRHTAHNSQEDSRTEMSVPDTATHLNFTFSHEMHDIEKTITDPKSLVAEDEKIKVRNQVEDVQSILLDAKLDNICNHDDMVTEDKYKDQEMGGIQLATFETQAHNEEFLSEQKPATIHVYNNMVRNEMSRMMTSIGMIVTVATNLFGPENTQIFFDMLAENTPHFESTGAISEFEPNMADPVIRQHVTSFFEHANYVMTQIMTSLSSVPDSDRLQQMPEPDFKALIKLFIKSLLESKSNLTKGLCLEGDKLTRDDLHHFLKTLGGNTPVDVLSRLQHGHEMFVYRFVDKNEEISQPTEKREKRLILSIYFPSDCRLFIHIPTEKGSYWHKLEMQRANK